VNGHAQITTLLTARGADCWVKNAAGNLPVYEAERAGREEVVAGLLLAGGRQEMDGGEEEGEVDGAARAGEQEGRGTAADEAAEKLARTGLEG